MGEQKLIRKRLIKNMIINFITFTIMFSIFDLIIYNQISISLYKSVDEELRMTKEQYITQQLMQRGTIQESNKENRVSMNMPEDGIKQYSDTRINPRLITIMRDESGAITNQSSIGRFYDEYYEDISFNKNSLDEIYTIKINGEYNYRGYNFKSTDKEGNAIYMQVLVNVDGEIVAIKNVFSVLTIGTAVIVIIAIIASYILSKKTIKPIVESWQKQTEFVQNASHELRTPLTIIQTKQELLLQDPAKKIIDKSEDINISLKETKRLTKLIKELMILARSDSDKYELNKEVTNIDELIKEVVVPYKDFVSTQRKEVILDLEYGKEMKIDRNKISQLLIIILDNAIKYTSEGDNITISTYNKDNKFNLEIADTGIGISDEGLKHIFDRFYREDKARSRETGGTGLGLSIARTIVEAHGGNIKITHNEPKGTKVIIKL